MIKSFAFAATLISSQSFAFAPYTGPVLIKITNSGYISPAYITSTKCEIYSNNNFNSKIVLTNGAGNIQSQFTKEVKITGDLAKAISDSQRGPFDREMAPVDGPGVIYSARKVNTNGSYQEIVLFNRALA